MAMEMRVYATQTFKRFFSEPKNFNKSERV